ncbi:MAG: hypothetical protein H6Q17_347 [Bacteroidetes bacterium]|nr:hypothetical protein [Bacteroidota bacterium]
MRNFFLLCFAVLLGSCTQYQYITLDSNIYHQDQQSFVWENDTVKIRYIFSGYNCPLTVQVYNKMNQPLYVDWKKSAVVYGDGSRWSLWNDDSYINTSTTNSAVRVRNNTYSSSSTDGVIQKREQISFIPPNSYVSVRPLAIVNGFFKSLPQNLREKVTFGDEGNTKVDKYSFTQENTPFTFRCFLTLSINDNFSNVTYIDKPFWVSEVMQTYMSPSSVLSSDNMFYVNKTTTFGHIMGGVGTVAIVGGVIYLNEVADPEPMRHHGR